MHHLFVSVWGARALERVSDFDEPPVSFELSIWLTVRREPLFGLWACLHQLYANLRCGPTLLLFGGNDRAYMEAIRFIVYGT